MNTQSKDDRHTVIGTGIVSPLLLLVMVLGHFATGVAWIPEPQLQMFRYFHSEYWHRLTPDHWGFWCVVAGELGLLLACLGWYFFANTKQYEWLARPFVLFGYVGLSIAVLGLIVALFKSLCWIV